ncbi:YihY/virulence factor BrkB family protein [Larkinella punicea]|uniref:YihY/virulence factor BrkB family protein n=1 Tax=Larkinella punicea TaxID=2315727 RepID=A0A368JTA9_9BACT|nr:YihY/virulence factor BrkB family protein [Larkinella punicea]RCR70909.1 YihY/virulence factor BrkB family protein [Larkinella punicea]
MLEKLMRYNSVQRVIIYLQKHQAFDSRQNWFDFLKCFIPKVTDNDTSERAASVAFSLILAVFPAIIFLFTLIPMIPIPNLEGQVMDFFSQVLPASTYETVKTTIYDIISRPRSNVLSFGFLLALYAATNGILSLMMAFNSSHKTGERRGFFKTRLIALGLTIMLALALFLAIAGLVVGGVVTDYLMHIRILDNVVVTTLLNIARYLVVFAVFVAAISMIYKFAPDIDMKWKFVNPGCIIASVLVVLTTYGFSFYVSNFGSYNKLYGSIGTLIVLMIWINLVCLLLIIGFDLNVALYQMEGDKNPQVGEKTINAPQTA